MMLAISRMHSINRTEEVSTLWPIPRALEIPQQLSWNLAVSFGIKNTAKQNYPNSNYGTFIYTKTFKEKSNFQCRNKNRTHNLA
jgi:hypothetical protein